MSRLALMIPALRTAAWRSKLTSPSVLVEATVLVVVLATISRASDTLFFLTRRCDLLERSSAEMVASSSSVDLDRSSMLSSMLPATLTSRVST